MRTLTITRTISNEFATYGRLTDDDGNVPLAVTLELPWRNNEHATSCVPAGRYQVARTSTPRHGEVFELQDVPGRTAILMHVANLPRDIEGCIGIGDVFGDVEDPDDDVTKPGIVRSKVAFARFMATMADVDAFTLTIAPAPGTIA